MSSIFPGLKLSGWMARQVPSGSAAAEHGGWHHQFQLRGLPLGGESQSHPWRLVGFCWFFRGFSVVFVHDPSVVFSTDKLREFFFAPNFCTTSSGFQGFDGRPPALESMDPLLDLGMTGNAKMAKKARPLRNL